VRACYSALRMQASVKRYAEDVFRSHGVSVEARVGMNSGEVVVRSVGSDLRMDYSAVGQTTHLAARMEQLARPGSVLLTGQTLKLAEGYVEVTARGPAPVKGLSEPVEVFEATGAGPARRRFDTSAIRGLSRFVGRSNELKQMRKALEQAAQAQGQVVALVGEPGVGKTRLFHEFTHSHRTAGWLILESGSVSYGKATPYLPLIDLLKAYFRIEPRDSERSVREKATGKLLALDRSLEPALPAICALLDVPVEDAHWNALDPAQRRSRMLDACKRLLLRESQVQPLLVVFEDLHWVDAETQAFLDSLIDSVPSARLLLLVNYRPEYVHRWGNRTYYLQLRVDPLGAENATELLDALLGGDAALASLKRLLVAKTEGNPFFLEESVRTLVETGALAGERGAHRLTQAVDALQVPATVQAILASRVDRLLPEDKRLLQLAAVVGHDVPMRLLEALAEEGEDALREGLARLQAAEFLYEASLFPELEYSFKHALTHEVTYGGLLQERRRQLHARVMEAIERVHAGRTAEHVEALARHALRAEAWEKAADYLRDAGALAQARGALADVLQRYEQALEAVARLPRTGDNLRRGIDARLDLANALPTLGRIGRAIDLLGEAEPLALEIADAARQGRIAVQMGGLLWFDGRYREALAQAKRAQAIAESLDDAVLRLRALYGIAVNHAMMGAYRAAIEHMAPLTESPGAETAKRLSSAMSASFYVAALGWRASWHALLGEFDAAIEYGDRGVTYADASGVPRARAYAYQYRGLVSRLRGDFAPALALYEQVLELSEKEGMTFWVSTAALFLGRTLADLGRAEEGLAHSLRGIALQEQMGTRVNLASLRSTHAATLLLAGRIADAHAEAERALEIARAAGERLGEAGALATLGRVLSASGPAEVGAATTAWQQSLALAAELGMRPLVALCHLNLGRVCAQAADRGGARDQLAIAATLFREMGMATFLKQAEAELESIG
jgi:tetratricopeptide (TPR) repeat protein